MRPDICIFRRLLADGQCCSPEDHILRSVLGRSGKMPLSSQESWALVIAIQHHPRESAVVIEAPSQLILGLEGSSVEPDLI